ncbi:hypothetical protein PPL_06709 [Heterostelium album PN500]|uniref:Uncharacterized protein n=1 Tax=Heterostelium pallidum (strain ATCC 26659 / Pp 5 / PN500) TaxID=670386 RepID=D3BFH5_HETP5|nr:hypothetical protein PPL_06709 [Heterostelium album PN500]EFA79889.1 hypothetical protein PPL_06709 [Heterostelium album PN500]|eukprot:XP_020432010.1 hypothetical protein PPL_06709 [Heterostelium album PN500]
MLSSRLVRVFNHGLNRSFTTITGSTCTKKMLSLNSNQYNNNNNSNSDNNNYRYNNNNNSEKESNSNNKNEYNEKNGRFNKYGGQALFAFSFGSLFGWKKEDAMLSQAKRKPRAPVTDFEDALEWYQTYYQNGADLDNFPVAMAYLLERQRPTDTGETSDDPIVLLHPDGWIHGGDLPSEPDQDQTVVRVADVKGGHHHTLEVDTRQSRPIDALDAGSVTRRLQRGRGDSAGDRQEVAGRQAGRVARESRRESGVAQIVVVEAA